MPDLTRRAVLGGGLALAGLAACTATQAGDSAGQTPSPALDRADWGSVRAQFPLARDVRQFSAWVLAAHPRPVADAIARHRAGLDADTHGYLDEQAGAEDAVRAAAAEYLGARPNEVALTDSTTQGLGLLYGGLRLAPGQDVLTTEHDFLSTHQSLAQRAARTGATVRRVRLYDHPAGATAGAIVDRLMAGVTPATRVVAITWVHSVSGVKLPVRAIADALAARNAGRGPDERTLLCVDGVHGLGAEDASVADLGCDFLVAGTHKWLFGPRGTGLVWGRAEAWQAIEPVVPSFSGPVFAQWLDGAPAAPLTGAAFTPGGYHSFEHRWALAEAFAFHRSLGRDRVAARTREQATRIKQALAGGPVRLVTPLDPALSSGIICLEPERESAPAAVGRLRAAGIVATTTPYREQRLRVGPSIVTSDEDCDALVTALRG